MSVPVLDIPLRPSRILAWGLLLLYGITALLLIWPPFTLPLRLLLGVFLLMAAWRAWRTWRLLTSILRLQVLPESYRLITTNGDLDVRVAGQTVVTPWLMILYLRGGGRPLHLPLLPDTSSVEDRRRLRVWLRCK